MGRADPAPEFRRLLGSTERVPEQRAELCARALAVVRDRVCWHRGRRFAGARLDVVRAAPARLGDSGLLFGSLVDMPGPVAAKRACEQFIGEQPGLETLATPVFAQLLQQPRRERNVAVLGALALVDTQRHAFGIDIAHAHPPDLARPQPRGIGRHQHRAMLGVRRDGEQPHQLVVVEDLGQGRRRLGAGQVEVRIRHTESDAVQEAHAVTHAVAALPAQPPLFVQVDEIVLNLLGRDLVGTAAVVTGEPCDGGEVGLLGVLGKSPNGHVIDHALTQRCHRSSPYVT